LPPTDTAIAEEKPSVLEQKIEVDGILTRYLSAGSGPPLVLLHGAGDNACDWSYVLPLLGRSHRARARKRWSRQAALPTPQGWSWPMIRRPSWPRSSSCWPITACGSASRPPRKWPPPDGARVARHACSAGLSRAVTTLRPRCPPRRAVWESATQDATGPACVATAGRALGPVAAGQPAKLEAAEALAQLAEEAGLSLIELAIAFALNYPAVTAAIIGPRTMEQLESQLPAAEVVLDALLDRIDQIRAATTLACAEHAGPVVGASLRVVAARLSDHQ